MWPDPLEWKSQSESTVENVWWLAVSSVQELRLVRVSTYSFRLARGQLR